MVKKDTKIFIGIWTIIIIIIGFIYLGFSNSMMSDSNNMNLVSGNMDENVMMSNAPTKIINVEAFQFGFKPNVIEVNYGDKVVLTAKSLDVPHGLAIDGYPEVNLYLDGVNSDSVTFIANKIGRFTFYCSVPCGAGHGNMKGTFIVK